MAIAAIKIRDYDQLRSAIAARRRQLGLRQLEADEKSGLMGGYFGKIECGLRKLGDISLPNVLAALDCDLYLAPRTAVSPVDQRTGSAGRALHLRSESQS